MKEQKTGTADVLNSLYFVSFYNAGLNSKSIKDIFGHGCSGRPLV